MIILKSQRELERMRLSGQITARVLADLACLIKPGITTAKLDRTGGELIRKQGAVSASLGYHGYPGNICISVNEEVVHGRGGPRVLKEGDIVSLDIGVRYGGYCGDMAATFPVGQISEEKKRLLAVAEEALSGAVEQARVGNRLYDISAAIQQKAESAGYSVVRDFVGHGIGSEMHEDPQVPNYGKPGTGPLLQAGMVLAIEPMVNRGTHEVEVLSDGWTVVTKDGEPSAHFEHTVAITENRPEILTWLKMNQSS